MNIKSSFSRVEFLNFSPVEISTIPPEMFCFSCEQAKSECDWLVMTSLFVANQSSYFFLSSRDIIKGPLTLATFAAISSATFSFWRMWTSGPVTNVEVRKHALSTFVIDPLVHIYQKEKMAAR